jgi:hypothetical protein
MLITFTFAKSLGNGQLCLQILSSLNFQLLSKHSSFNASPIPLLLTIFELLDPSDNIGCPKQNNLANGLSNCNCFQDIIVNLG